MTSKFDGKEFGEEVLRAISRSLAPLKERLTALENDASPKGQKYGGIFKYEMGKSYPPNCLVSYGSSFWLSKRFTASMPGNNNAWQEIPSPHPQVKL